MRLLEALKVIRIEAQVLPRISNCVFQRKNIIGQTKTNIPENFKLYDIGHESMYNLIKNYFAWEIEYECSNNNCKSRSPEDISNGNMCGMNMHAWIEL